MGADLYAMIKLPKILYEFGKLMEAYGAFQSALGIRFLKVKYSFNFNLNVLF